LASWAADGHPDDPWGDYAVASPGWHPRPWEDTYPWGGSRDDDWSWADTVWPPEAVGDLEEGEVPIELVGRRELARRRIGGLDRWSPFQMAEYQLSRRVGGAPAQVDWPWLVAATAWLSLDVAGTGGGNRDWPWSTAPPPIGWRDERVDRHMGPWWWRLEELVVAPLEALTAAAADPAARCDRAAAEAALTRAWQASKNPGTPRFVWVDDGPPAAPGPRWTACLSHHFTLPAPGHLWELIWRVLGAGHPLVRRLARGGPAPAEFGWEHWLPFALFDRTAVTYDLRQDERRRWTSQEHWSPDPVCAALGEAFQHIAGCVIDGDTLWLRERSGSVLPEEWEGADTGADPVSPPAPRPAGPRTPPWPAGWAATPTGRGSRYRSRCVAGGGPRGRFLWRIVHCSLFVANLS
jgi:hypothetical protein